MAFQRDIMCFHVSRAIVKMVGKVSIRNCVNKRSSENVYFEVDLVFFG